MSGRAYYTPTPAASPGGTERRVPRERPGSALRSAAPWIAIGIAVGTALAAASAKPATAAGEPSKTETGTATGRPTAIVLLTLDTTRADYLGSYGGRAATPTLDDLARRGTRWARAVAAAPLTLPSHASLLTGLDPPFHGVLDNGTSILPAGLPTLASALAARGWATAAFVASRVLDRRFGLDRGFDRYDDRMAAEVLGEYGYPERDAAAVTSAALSWLAGRPADRPFFLWVHYYDPHAPYRPPPALRGRTPEDDYAGEIAFMDREIGRLLGAVGDRAGARPLIAAVGDHGEGLGSHGEPGHGVFLYSAGLHVPLLLAGPGVAAGKVVEETVASRRLAPTLLALAGVEEDQGTRLPGLPSLGDDPSPEPVYSATWMPANTYGWAPLTAWTEQRWRLIRAPRPELYDLVADPGETRNLLTENGAEARRLAAVLGAYETGRSRRRAPAAEVGEGLRDDLRSLGYVSRRQSDGGGTIDPKDGLALLAELRQAKGDLAAGRTARALEVLERLVRAQPRNVPFLSNLAAAQIAAGRLADGLATRRRAIELRPRSHFLHLHLAQACLAAGRREEAAAAYRRAVELDPRSATAWLGLAEIAGRAGDGVEERRLLESSVGSGTASAAIRSRLGQLVAEAGDPAAATVHFRVATELTPDWPLPWLWWGRALLAAGRREEARGVLERAASLAPASAEGREARRLLAGL